MGSRDPAVSMHVLALNSGSSSLKFGLYEARAKRLTCLVEGEADRVGHADGVLRAVDGSGRVLCRERMALRTSDEALPHLVGLFERIGAPAPEAVGHRVVHGGPGLLAHCRIDAPVREQLTRASAFAPLHMPPMLAVLERAERNFAGVPQIACLDTAFHAQMPDRARVLPLPERFRALGIERYGFHGLSCESIVAQFCQTLPRRLLIAHLGNGASVTAVKDGVSMDTSMGLTPTGGLIMGTRSGDLDPGVLLHLAREEGLDAASLAAMIDQHSGLAGISGLDGDMRTLRTAAAAGHENAALAIRMFCYAARKQMAALWSVLDGVDAIVFCGGIGEHDAAVRAEICSGLSSLGVRLDEARNSAAVNPLHGVDSSCRVHVLGAQEALQIARHTVALMGAA